MVAARRVRSLSTGAFLLSLTPCPFLVPSCYGTVRLVPPNHSLDCPLRNKDSTQAADRKDVVR
jgi:hypothetical protein